MKKGRKLYYNTVLLTVSGIIMRCIGLGFQVWLAGSIGSSGLGLFQLVMSTGFLASTFAVSGIRFASTRLISEELGSGSSGVGSAVHRCVGYASFFGLASAALLFLYSEPIGFLWIGDARTVLSLRIFAISLPFTALSAVMSGYFTAVGRVWKSALIGFLEQIIRFAACILLLLSVKTGDLEKSCCAVIAGGVIADAAACCFIVSAYFLDRKHHRTGGITSEKLTRRMLRIALPLAVSAYTRTSLTTLQSLLVPRGLKASGLSAEAALSGYGTITGMVFPIVMFPSCLLSALAELLVPELTEAQVAGERLRIRLTVDKLLRRCLDFSLGVGGVMFAFAEELGMVFYSSAEAGGYIKIFACIVPIMYMDMVVDGCLKGLGQMMHSMTINIFEAMLGVFLVWKLLPVYALDGYIWIVCLGECLNFVLSITRLKKVTGIRIQPLAILTPAVLSLACGLGAEYITGLFISVPAISLILGILSAAGAYSLAVHTACK